MGCGEVANWLHLLNRFSDSRGVFSVTPLDSVGVKRFLDLHRIGCLGERQHQRDASFLWIERVSGDEAKCVIIKLVVSPDNAAVGARGAGKCRSTLTSANPIREESKCSRRILSVGNIAGILVDNWAGDQTSRNRETDRTLAPETRKCLATLRHILCEEPNALQTLLTEPRFSDPAIPWVQKSIRYAASHSSTLPKVHPRFRRSWDP